MLSQSIRRWGRARGLTNPEAEARLHRFGPNVVPEETPPVWRTLLMKVWTPVFWMPERTSALELVLRKPLEALVFALLLAFNGILGFAQEHRAQRALMFLRERLTVEARVHRERWFRATSCFCAPATSCRRIRACSTAA